MTLDLAGRDYYNPNAPRARAIRRIMDKLEAVGLQPTPTLIYAHLDKTLGRAGMAGRDGITFTTYMPELGYVQEHSGARWHKPGVPTRK